jgi:deoxycytidylate deaminase
MTNRLNVFVNFTKSLATLSKCEERKVAAIITDKTLSQIYSIGINGGPKGLINCMCKLGGKYGCIHAEINALTKCTSVEPEKVMIVTLSPCIACAAAIINAPGGFSTVYYLEQWKDDNGIKLLKSAGINVIHLQ